MKKTPKASNIFPNFWFIASIVLFIIFVLFVLAVLFGFQKSVERAHRNWLLYDQVGKIGKSLDAYAKDKGVYPEKIETVHSRRICAMYITEACTNIYYKPSKDLKSFKMAAKGLRGDILYYSSGGIYSQTAYDRKGFKVLKEGVTYYLEDKALFPNASEWPSYSDLEKK